MDCPPTPASEREEDLGFKRKTMVAWFAPLQLIDAGLRAVLAAVFGTYADKREMQAALEKPQEHDELAGEEEVWIDYAADLGDGWDSTYTIARLMAEEQRDFEYAGENEPQRYQTRRGQLLILGGDQVYPTASREEYRNRFEGPYTAALPCVVNGKPPLMFAIPGNHDWYDGLTSFVRLFCQGRWIGGWQTKQSRSYFAIRLPHDWWIWAIDIQLHADIDRPQLDYFRSVATGSLDGRELQKNFLQGHRIILCTAQPSWVETGKNGSQAYANLDFFERKIIQENGGTLVLTLTGDLHHYTRYHDNRGRNKITAGGGGAYLYGTHELPKELILGRDKVRYSQTERSFPDVASSRRLAWHVLRFAFMRMNWGFTGLVGLLYLLYAWIVQSESRKLGGNFLEAISELPLNPSGIAGVLAAWISVIAHSPMSVVFLLAVVLGLGVFCDGREPLVRWPTGILHGTAHVALNLALIWGIAHMNLRLLGLQVDTAPQVLLFIVEILALGAPAGGLVMALYLALTNRFLHLHQNEVFVTQAIADYKNFVRMHLDKRGHLTIYPVGVRTVTKTWRFNDRAQNGQPWFDPVGGDVEAHLIEDPIEIGV